MSTDILINMILLCHTILIFNNEVNIQLINILINLKGIYSNEA